MAAAASNMLATHLRPLLDGLSLSIRAIPRLVSLTLLMTVLGVSVPPAFSYARASYRGYLALGPGGIPYNVFGWALQGALQLLAHWDTRDPSPFTDPRNRRPYEPYGSCTFFQAPIPPRARHSAGGTGAGDGEESSSCRPEVPGYVAPQRQITQQPLGKQSKETRHRMTAYLEDLVKRNPGVLALKPSGLEGIGTPAVYLDTATATSTLPRGAVPKFMRTTKGEMVHVHSECSSHITLSMADAEEVVRKGWAERHRLSGVMGLPWGYVLIYAPRDDAEYEVWRAIVRAGLQFVCASAGRQVVTG
ncbi:hypothetical protein BD289DRAFT_440844 [Coniella lustricola]|uniref:Luciferase domain-containing protein n=1 Tax=Coniella lustricola TaxID=2025994 RepID=A0A2T3A037_9PEZI|nr:hypothetical protein BD289DRAFT_440844 [Coniella lustricola]